MATESSYTGETNSTQIMALYALFNFIFGEFHHPRYHRTDKISVLIDLSIPLIEANPWYLPKEEIDFLSSHIRGPHDIPSLAHMLEIYLNHSKTPEDHLWLFNKFDELADLRKTSFSEFSAHQWGARKIFKPLLVDDLDSIQQYGSRKKIYVKKEADTLHYRVCLPGGEEKRGSIELSLLTSDHTISVDQRWVQNHQIKIFKALFDTHSPEFEQQYKKPLLLAVLESMKQASEGPIPYFKKNSPFSEQQLLKKLSKIVKPDNKVSSLTPFYEDSMKTIDALVREYLTPRSVYDEANHRKKIIHLIEAFIAHDKTALSSSYPSIFLTKILQNIIPLEKTFDSHPLNTYSIPLFYSVFKKHIPHETILTILSNAAKEFPNVLFSQKCYSRRNPMNLTPSRWLSQELRRWEVILKNEIGQKDGDLYAFVRELPEHPPLESALLKSELDWYFPLLAEHVVISVHPDQEATARKFPLVLQVMLQHASLETRLVFFDFFDLLVRENENPQNEKKESFMKSFLHHYPIMAQLIQIMQEQGILFLRRHLTYGFESLEAVFKLLTVFPPDMTLQLTSFYKKNKTLILKNRDENKHFDHVLLLLSTLFTLEKMVFEMYELQEKPNRRDREIAQRITLIDHEQMISWLTQEITRAQTPFELMLTLGKKLITLLLRDSSMDFSNFDIESLFQRVSPQKLSQLLLVFSKSEVKNHLFILLRAFLMDNSADDFLHNTQQDHPLGKPLALHNLAIQEALKEEGINPGSALNYQKTLEFSFIQNEEGFSHERSLETLLASLKKVKLHIEQEEQKELPGSMKKSLQKIKINITHIERNIEKHKNTLSLEKIFMQPTPQNNLAVIRQALENFSQNYREDARLNRDYFEHATHTLEHMAHCQSFLSEKPEESLRNKSLSHNKEHQFRVIQWKKDQLLTFFLGDEVGCCLASNGTQFDAMLFRIMDDALLFHVVIDVKKNKPVALAWLYFAELTKGGICLIANFFEVKAVYGRQDNFRQALLQALLAFTHQYCLDHPKICGFYMNPLSYGWHQNDLKHYETTPLELINKLGGLLQYNPFWIMPNNKEQVSYRYHLDSLFKEIKSSDKEIESSSKESLHFHPFDRKVLDARKMPGLRYQHEQAQTLQTSSSTPLTAPSSQSYSSAFFQKEPMTQKINFSDSESNTLPSCFFNMMS